MKKILMIFVFAIVGLTFASAQVNETKDKDFDYYNAPSWLWTFDYSMGFASGDLNTFLDGAPSFRGFNIGTRYFLLDNKISIGTSVGWNGYYKDFGRKSVEFESGAITSNMYRYVYVTRLDFNVHYYVLDEEALIQPYIGFQFGPHVIRKQTQVGSYYVETETGNFTMAPEIGLYIPFGEHAEWAWHTSARYNYSIYNQDNFEGLSYIQLNCGFVYKY